MEGRKANPNTFFMLSSQEQKILSFLDAYPNTFLTTFLHYFYISESFLIHPNTFEPTAFLSIVDDKHKHQYLLTVPARAYATTSGGEAR